MVSERQLAVLRVIVQDYVASREPVGSKSIVDRHSFGVSAATIRNDMALLEEEELIAAPHTSSGRVPTDKGYRLFVDQLTDLRPLTAAQRHAIETFLGAVRRPRRRARAHGAAALAAHPPGRAGAVPVAQPGARPAHRAGRAHATRACSRCSSPTPAASSSASSSSPTPIDEAAARRAAHPAATACSAVSAMTDAAERLAGLVDDVAPDARALAAAVVHALVEQVLAHRQDRLVMAGAANLVRTESDFSGSIFPVLEAIEEQVVLLRLFGEMAADQNGVSRQHRPGERVVRPRRDLDHAERLLGLAGRRRAASACSARRAWTTRTTWRRSAPSPATSRSSSPRAEGHPGTSPDG